MDPEANVLDWEAARRSKKYPGLDPPGLGRAPRLVFIQYMLKNLCGCIHTSERAPRIGATFCTRQRPSCVGTTVRTLHVSFNKLLEVVSAALFPILFSFLPFFLPVSPSSSLFLSTECETRRETVCRPSTMLFPWPGSGFRSQHKETFFFNPDLFFCCCLESAWP